MSLKHEASFHEISSVRISPIVSRLSFNIINVKIQTKSAHDTWLIGLLSLLFFKLPSPISNLVSCFLENPCHLSCRFFHIVGFADLGLII